MYAVTVHRPLERVNTLCRVTDEETPGARLKGYIRARWTRKDGGWEKLATEAKLRGRQTLNEWFSGEKEPSLSSLQQVAKVLGVRRVDLLAAYDGEIAPETQRSTAPSMTRRLLAGVIALEQRANVSPEELSSAQDSAAAIEAALEADARIAAELEESRRRSDGRVAGQGGAPTGGSQGNRRRRR